MLLNKRTIHIIGGVNLKELFGFHVENTDKETKKIGEQIMKRKVATGILVLSILISSLAGCGAAHTDTAAVAGREAATDTEVSAGSAKLRGCIRRSPSDG